MIDINEIRAANPLPDVAGAYIELRRDGREFKACCPFHGDKTPSFTIYQARGDQAWRYQCFGCGARGDVLDFIREIEGVDFNEAARRLGARELPASRPPRPIPPDASEDWMPICPAPAGVAQPFVNEDGVWRVWNPKRDRESTLRPSASWAYRDAAGALLGWVIRCDFDDGGKLTPAITHCRHRETGEARWCMRLFPTPRPLLGLDDLAARPDRPVLVVEGEKCRAAAARLLPGFVAVTWPGGTRGARHADLSPLRGRAVTLWPDADDPGLEVMDYIGGQLAEHCLESALRILDVSGQPKGWDIADAEAEGMRTADMVAWCKARVRVWVAPVDPEPDAKPAPVDPEPVIEATAPAASDPEPVTSSSAEYFEAEEVDETPMPPASKVYSTIKVWRDLSLEMSDRGIPHPNLDNACRALERHPDMVGKFWFDTFRGNVMTCWNSENEVREWKDADDVRLALWMQRKLSLGKMGVTTARDAVTAIAMENQRNECAEWLLSLRWDGAERLGDMMAKAWGAAPGVYATRVGQCWMTSMVARVLRPGCKVDTMPVFEGEQGVTKSSALKLLADPWYAEGHTSVLSKDFYLVMQGKMLIEIAEMHSFNRSQVDEVKGIISNQIDRFRAPYGRRAADHPRHTVFAGTTNRDDWNQDDTGARRFWPITCTHVDMDWIRDNRVQLFAEAVARFRSGQDWWDIPKNLTTIEQDKRRRHDTWEDDVREYLVGKSRVKLGDVMFHGLKIDPAKQTQNDQRRAGSVMRALGWRSVVEWDGGRSIRYWKPEPGKASVGSDDLL